MNRAQIPERGCGFREAGGIYWTMSLSPFGQPVEAFLICPTVVIDMEALGAKSIGVTELAAQPGRHGSNFLDIVGVHNYPNVADFIEEVRRFGLSRRIPLTLDFSKIGPDSRLILAHRCANVGDHAAEYYWPTDGTRFTGCRREMATGSHYGPGEGGDRLIAGIPESHLVEAHDAGVSLPTCCGVAWDDLGEGAAYIGGSGSRDIRRDMPSFSYTGQCEPDGVKPRYKTAAFASFPLGALQVVRDAEGGQHELAMERVQQMGRSAELVDE